MVPKRTSRSIPFLHSLAGRGSEPPVSCPPVNSTNLCMQVSCLKPNRRYFRGLPKRGRGSTESVFHFSAIRFSSTVRRKPTNRPANLGLRSGTLPPVPLPDGRSLFVIAVAVMLLLARWAGRDSTRRPHDTELGYCRSGFRGSADRSLPMSHGNNPAIAPCPAQPSSDLASRQQAHYRMAAHFFGWRQILCHQGRRSTALRLSSACLFR